jgi:serine/threonine-protein kinase
MPRAEKSLRKHLEEAGGKLDVDEAVAILTDVAEALASLGAKVVHRDLKPENVILYEDHWCLADFGIARYAEATTASDTHKHAMSPPYAAPEQWRGERATNATDVYAFGVMAFELVQGTLPFPGPDYRKQHLNYPPPALSDCPPWLASIINECLFKPGAARPTAANILARLRVSERPTSLAVKRLQEVQKAVVERKVVETARMSAQKSKEKIREELFQTSKQSFDKITTALQQRVVDAAPDTEVSTSGGRLVLRLADGALIIDQVQTAPADCLAAFDYEPAFDVITYTAIAARKPLDHHGYEGRAHSLWFCDAHNYGIYRWYELAFMNSPFISKRSTLDPFALPPTDEHTAAAFTPVLGILQLAWKPIPFDQGEEDEFIERWLKWFAEAADGSLSHPRTMPENSGGWYRRPGRRQRRT